MSTTSNLTRFASRPSVANLSMAQKQIAPTTTIIKTPIKAEIMATSLCCRNSFPLRLGLVDPIFAKLRWSLGKPAPALGAFFRRCGRIDNVFDGLCGELLSAQSPAGLADGLRGRLDPEPERDQAANGVRSGNVLVRCSSEPGIARSKLVSVPALTHLRTAPGRGRPSPFLFSGDPN